MHESSRTDRPGLGALLLLALLAAAVLGPAAWQAQFLNFDDNIYYGGQSALRGGAFLTALDPSVKVANAWLPVTHLSIALDLALFDGPRGPHLHSLLLQVLAAFCLARLFGRLGLGKAASVAGAALFLLHPALVESSLWLSGRKDLLSGIFVFLALDATAAATRGDRSPGRGATSAGAFALLAVYAKGSALVLPLLAPLVIWLARPRPEEGETPWAALRRGLPALSALLAVALLAGLHHTSIAVAEQTMLDAQPLSERLLRVPGAFLHYLSTALWPSGLDVLYPEVKTLQGFADRLLPGFLVLIGYGAAVVWLRRRAPRVSLGLLWFGLALLPFNTALPATSLAAADRYLYLALPGLALALAGLRPPVGVALAGLCCVPLAFLSANRAAEFETSETLWRASLARDPDNAVALINCAQHLLANGGQLREAEDLLDQAALAARYPQHRWRAERQLAGLAEATGRIEGALYHAELAAEVSDGFGAGELAQAIRLEDHLQAARLARRFGEEETALRHQRIAEELNPRHILVACFRASLLLADSLEAGDLRADDPRRIEAEALLDEVEKLQPELYELHWTRGEWARASGELLSATRHFGRAIDLQPTRPEAWLAEVDLLLAQPDMAANAVNRIREALEAGVNDSGLRFRLALALGQLGRMDEARRSYEQYLLLRPGDRDARLGLARILAAIGMQKLYQMTPEEADAMATRIQELEPGNRKARLMQAVGARGRHEMQAALVLLESLYEDQPEDAEIRRLYAETLRDRGWQLKLNEGRDELAIDHFVRFREVAPVEVPTEAVDNVLELAWEQQLERGQQALLERDPATAEPAMRRCLEILPERHSPNLQLGIALLMAGDRLAEALAAFEAAEAGQRATGGDPGLAVFYRIRALQALERDAEAKALGDAYLEQVGEGGDPQLLDRIRQSLQGY